MRRWGWPRTAVTALGVPPPSPRGWGNPPRLEFQLFRGWLVSNQLLQLWHVSCESLCKFIEGLPWKKPVQKLVTKEASRNGEGASRHSACCTTAVKDLGCHPDCLGALRPLTTPVTTRPVTNCSVPLHFIPSGNPNGTYLKQLSELDELKRKIKNEKLLEC